MTDTPQDKRLLSAPPQAGATDWLYSPKLRGLATQALVLALLLWGVYEMVVNASANLAKLNQNFGFDFLSKAAGFDFSTSLIQFTSTSSYNSRVCIGHDFFDGAGCCYRHYAAFQKPSALWFCDHFY
jgi:general L-amino acid transport system permease protein